MKKSALLIYVFFTLIISSCKKDKDSQPLPTHTNPGFTVESLDSYHFKVTVSNPDIIGHTFIFAGTDTSKQLTDTVYFPFEGTYSITMKAITSKDSVNSAKTVTITSNDPSNPDLNDPLVALLTGGINDEDGKTWILDTSAYTMGIGPSNTLTPDYHVYSYPLKGADWENGMGQNSFTFKLKNYQYIPKNSYVTIDAFNAYWYFGAPSPYTNIAISHPAHKQTSFTIKNANNGIGTGYTLKINNGSYIGYYLNRNFYEILSITEDRLYLRLQFNWDEPGTSVNPENDLNAFYFTLKAVK